MSQVPNSEGLTSRPSSDPTQPAALASALLEHSPLLVYVADPGHRIVLINRSLRNLCGWGTSDCPDLGSLLRHFYPDNEYRAIVEQLHEGWTQEKHLSDTELDVSTRDGSRRTVSWRSCSLRLGKGPALGTLAMGVDVTAQKGLQNWLALFQASFEHISEGVILVDPGGRILAWNRGATELLGHSGSDMEGLGLKGLFHPAERELTAQTMRQRLDEFGLFEGKVDIETKGGERRKVELRQLRITGSDGGALAVLTLIANNQADHALQERFVEFQTRLEEYETSLAEMEEAWLRERSTMVETHREELAEQYGRMARSRQDLEAQVSRDILAAEDRAEADRGRVLEELGEERSEWKNTISIARAEAESELREEIQLLRRRLDRPESLQPHLAQLADVAMVAADTDGRIVGWSGGAASLDERSESAVVGGTIHEDALQLEDVDWKTLVGKVIIAGRHEEEVTLVTAGGERREVLLSARLVHDADGRPSGVTELLVPRDQGAGPQLTDPVDISQELRRARSRPTIGIQAVAIPVLQALETRALESEQALGKLMEEIDPDELGTQAQEAMERAEDSCRTLRTQVGRLRQLSETAQPDGEDTHRWNELVDRCLELFEEAGASPVERDFGESAVLLGRGPLLVPLLLGLFSTLPVGGDRCRVTTSVDEEGRVHLVVDCPSLSTKTLNLAQELARACGGSLTSEDNKNLTRYELMVPVILPDRLATRDQSMGEAARSSHILDALGLDESVDEQGPGQMDEAEAEEAAAAQEAAEAEEAAKAAKGKMVLTAASSSDTMRMKALVDDPDEEDSSAAEDLEEDPGEKKKKKKKAAKAGERKKSKKKAASKGKKTARTSKTKNSATSTGS